MHRVMNSTVLTKAKNDFLREIEKNREYTKTTYPEANLKLVDMVYDRECQAVVGFYYKLLEKL